MDISILGIATQVGGLGGISKINECQTTSASSSTWSRAGCNGIVLFFVDDDSVTGSIRKPVHVTGQAISGSDHIREGHWLGWVDGEELLHVEDLDSVVFQFTSTERVLVRFLLKCERSRG